MLKLTFDVNPGGAVKVRRLPPLPFRTSEFTTVFWAKTVNEAKGHAMQKRSRNFILVVSQ
jgi:hypothetical protein